ncbi:MAG TPA: DinB family protein [Ktedonobacteraceae bacterium]|nr:DinB family protein [Ktedonobacteraceae bacterium]
MPYTETVQKVHRILTETVAEIETWFEMPEESRSYKPQDEGWSINEILEHITLTSHYLLLIIEKGCKKALRRASQGEPIPEGESDLARLEPIGHPDAFPWIRPEHMEPTRTPTLEEVRAQIQRQYQECLRILTALKQGEGALYTVRMSVQDLGKMDMYQWLYFLALHQQRHIRQMEQVYQEWEQKRQ